MALRPDALKYIIAVIINPWIHLPRLVWSRSEIYNWLRIQVDENR